MEQVKTHTKLYSKYMDPIKIVDITGGVSAPKQLEAMKEGVDVIVSTPGRLRALLKPKHKKSKNWQDTQLNEEEMEHEEMEHYEETDEKHSEEQELEVKESEETSETESTQTNNEVKLDLSRVQTLIV